MSKIMGVTFVIIAALLCVSIIGIAYDGDDECKKYAEEETATYMFGESGLSYFDDNDLKIRYTINPGTTDVSVSRIPDMNLPSGALTIPATATHDHVTYNVTSIGYAAFYGCFGLTNITIQGNLEDIGEFAFKGCTGLTTVTILGDAYSISYSAFEGCEGLSSVTIKGNAGTIHSEAFRFCTGLTSVTIQGDVGVICKDAFLVCNKLKEVTMGGNVETIGKNAFNNCTGLTTMTIKGHVKTIDEYAFFSCIGLVSITIPSDATTIIGKGAFHTCNGLTSVTIQGDVGTIGEDAFYGCSDFTTMTIQGDVGTIGEGAFYGCSDFTTMTIQGDVGTIGEDAFSTVGLESLTIQGDIGTICEGAFCDTELTSICLGNITTICKNAFSFSNLTSMTIQGNVETISDYAFSNTRLTSVTIQGDVGTIGAYIFWYCETLTEFIIYGDVGLISSHAFLLYSGQMSMIIHGNVGTICEEAFSFYPGFSLVILQGDIAEDTKLADTSDVIEISSVEMKSYTKIETVIKSTPIINEDKAILKITSDVIKNAIDISKKVLTTDSMGSTPSIKIAPTITTTSVNEAITEISTTAMYDVAMAKAEISISSPIGEIILDSGVVSKLAEISGEKVSITIGKASKAELTEKQREVIGDKPVFKLSAVVGITPVHKLEGVATISVNYTPVFEEDTSKIAIFYVDDAGEMSMRDTIYEDGKLIFETSTFSFYTVGEKVVSNNVGMIPIVIGGIIIGILAPLSIVAYFLYYRKKRMIV